MSLHSNAQQRDPLPDQSEALQSCGLPPPPATLELTELAGSMLACGLEYGRLHQYAIRGFLAQEAAPAPERLAYAERCWRITEQQAPRAAEFMRGMSIGCGLDLNHITLLGLHEELIHQEPESGQGHCTAIALSGACTQDGRTYVGENWDWSAKYYPWPGLLQLDPADAPRVISYQFPGLWSCCGVNEAGLGLMWTGGGYWPSIPPVDGVPTYPLIAELLTRDTVAEALRYLKGTAYAGSFMFLLADRSGATAVVEAIPGTLHVESGADSYHRANLFLSPEVITASSQIDPDPSTMSSPRRVACIDRELAARQDSMSLSAIQQILNHSEVFVSEPGYFTVDRFVADCSEPALWVRRGGSPANGPWRRYAV